MSSRLLAYLVVGACVAVLGPGCSIRADKSSGGEILFVRDEGKRSAIHLMSADGSGVRRLVDGNEARWSPDGTRIAYRVDEHEHNRYRGTSLWVMNADTRGTRRILNADDIWALAWAPDGVRIAYSDLTRIFVVNTEKSDAKLISIEPYVDGLDWSRDGRELMMSAHFSSYVLDVASGAVREISSRRFVGEGRWSPDGEQVALAALSPGPLSKRTTRDIAIAPRAGGNPEHVTKGPIDSEPAWSHDGGEIYFTREPGSFLDDKDALGDSEIYAIDLETRSLRRLTENNVDDRLADARPEHRSLPDPPEPVTGGIVVPDLVGRHVLFEDERRRFNERGLTLTAVPPLHPEEGVLSVIEEQTPAGGSRVPRGTFVKVTGLDLTPVYQGRSFSERVWKAHPTCEALNPRGPMHFDVVRHVLERGMSKKRVLSLLGSPKRSDGRALDWPLGARTFGRVDCIYLRVEFDRRGRATRFYQALR